MAQGGFWDRYDSWEEAEAAWDRGGEKSAAESPLQGLKHLPKMVGITEETAKGLKWKALKWMVAQDEGEVRRGFMTHPFRYGRRYLKSLCSKSSHGREDDFFLYGVESVDHFSSLLESTEERLFVVGFSYCHKPFECPSGRFSDQCIADPENPVCRQCWIGKAIHALPREELAPLLIPTIHYIGAKIFEIVHAHPNKEVLFLITACEMTLEMFGDWGNMAGIRGLGVRLDGRICNTMRAFELSEKGTKPGLTLVLDETRQRILEIIRRRRQARNSSSHSQEVEEGASS